MDWERVTRTIMTMSPWTRDGLAVFFIQGMLWASAIQTVVYGVLWFMLLGQESGMLGRWINRLFLLTFLGTLYGTYLTTYLTRNATPDDIETWTEWSLIIGLTVLPLLVAWAGIMVAIWTRRTEEPDPTQDAFSDDTTGMLTQTADDVAEVKSDVRAIKRRMGEP